MTTSTAEGRGALAKQPVTAIIGYGLGDFSCNLAFSMSTAFLLLYYTDVAGISAAAVGTMFLVVRLYDAFADLFAGRMVDMTMTRWGKFRPFILFGAVPVLFLSFLCFYVPSNLDAGGKLLYAYLTYALLGTAYSLVNIPYGSLASAMTQSVNERAKLVASRAFGAAVGGVTLSYVVAPWIATVQKTAPKVANFAGGAKDPKFLEASTKYIADLQNIFTLVTGSLIVVGAITFFLTFLWCKESVVRVSKAVTIKETWETLKQNAPLAWLCGASFFYLIGVFSVGGSTAYYARYILGDTGATATMTLVNSGISMLITPIIPAIIAKLGKKNVFQWCGVFTIIGGVGLWFVPEKQSLSLTLALVLLAIKGIGASLINTVMFGLEADTVEYGEWKSGKRSEGATYSIFSFTRKLTQSLGGGIGAWFLAFGGYISASATNPNPTQPQLAIDAIKFTIGPFPALCAILAMLIFIKYPLTDKLFNQIRDENEARKAALHADASGHSDISGH